jgi:hypothetical protein
VSDTAFRVAVLAAAIIVGAAIARVSFCHSIDLPALPAKPSAPRIVVGEVAADVASDPAEYSQRLATDSRTLRVDPPATPADLSRVLPHQSSDKKLALEVRGKKASAEVLGLRLSLSVGDVEGTPRRQMILTIQNTTDQYLAYRVASRPSQGTRPCHEKSDFAHNAIALAPGEKVRRSECIYKSGWRLLIDRVETVVLPRLSYFYVSTLAPTALGLDRLSSRGHRAVGGRPPCQVFQSAVLDDALRSGATTWRDLIDFYARHPCQVYTFPNGYKAFATDGERPLPAVATGP